MPVFAMNGAWGFLQGTWEVQHRQMRHWFLLQQIQRKRMLIRVFTAYSPAN